MNDGCSPSPKRVPHVQVVDPAKIGRERITNCKNRTAARILHVSTDVDLQLYKLVRGETLQGLRPTNVDCSHGLFDCGAYEKYNFLLCD
jgi:hypothetical protein